MVSISESLACSSGVSGELELSPMDWLRLNQSGLSRNSQMKALSSKNTVKGAHTAGDRKGLRREGRYLKKAGVAMTIMG
jgi:hypothetical protein